MRNGGLGFVEKDEIFSSHDFLICFTFRAGYLRKWVGPRNGNGIKTQINQSYESNQPYFSWSLSSLDSFDTAIPVVLILRRHFLILLFPQPLYVFHDHRRRPSFQVVSTVSPNSLPLHKGYGLVRPALGCCKSARCEQQWPDPLSAGDFMAKFARFSVFHPSHAIFLVTDPFFPSIEKQTIFERLRL